MEDPDGGNDASQGPVAFCGGDFFHRTQMITGLQLPRLNTIYNHANAGRAELAPRRDCKTSKTQERHEDQ